MVLEQCNAVLQKATPHLAGFGHNLQASQKPACGAASEPVFLECTIWGCIYVNSAPIWVAGSGVHLTGLWATSFCFSRQVSNLGTRNGAL